MSDTSSKEAKNLPASFSVDPVAATGSPIWTEQLSDHLPKRFVRKVFLLPEGDMPVVNSMYDPSTRVRPSDMLAESLVSRCHPLIDAVATAFSQHRPLLLSPDCIWLAIEQGFAHHIAVNAETFRKRLVSHQGRHVLQATVTDLSLGSFEGAIGDWSSQIRAASDPVLHETSICDFSTTTPIIRTASEIVLMDCYSSYFTYFLTCICGIPKITVTGTTGDWESMRARIEILETFGLDWWVRRLRPILDEFIRTSKGHPSLTFWRAIYKPKQAYGTETVTGWIADLFPYLGDAPERRRSEIFDFERIEWAIPVEAGVKTFFGPGDPGAEMGVATKMFPSGLASVPLNVTLPRNANVSLDLVGGFLAVQQDPDDLALSPLIGWAVAESAPTKPVVLF